MTSLMLYFVIDKSLAVANKRFTNRIFLIYNNLDFTTGIFIDNSGSTCSQLVSIQKNVLQAELSICQVTKFDHIVLWNSYAQLCTNIDSASPTGGTNPTAIFQNQSTKNAFNQSDVIVFVTDGEIDNVSVTQVKNNNLHGNFRFLIFTLPSISLYYIKEFEVSFYNLIDLIKIHIFTQCNSKLLI